MELELCIGQIVLTVPVRAQMRSKLAAAACISASNSPSVPVCNSSTTNQRGGCLTFSLSHNTTSAYFPPPCHFLSFLFIPDPSVFLAASCFGLSSLLLASVCLSVSHSLLWRETSGCEKKRYSMLLPWQLHLGAEPVLFHRHACSISHPLSTCLT